MTVLIVEDNPGVRRLLRRAIHPVATDIWECEDGAEALDAYTGHRPDIVLMDIRMPRLDGLAATRQILRDHPKARVIIVTDYDDPQLRAVAERSGACAFVLKEDLTALAQVMTAVTVESTD